MENLATFSATEVKRAAAAAEERENGVFFCRRTVRVKVKNRVVVRSFLKIQERGPGVGAGERRQRDGIIRR